MRTLAYSTLAIFGSLSLLGILFKVMHWPGASMGMVTGIAGIALIGIPSFALYKLRSAKQVS